LERPLTGSFASSHLKALGVEDEVIANASSGDDSTPSTPSSLPSSVCSAFQDLDMFCVTSFELNPDTTGDGNESKDDTSQSSFFAGTDIEEWEAATHVAEQEETHDQADMEFDEDEEMEEVSQDDMDAIMGNMEETAQHIANDIDMSYMINFAPDLLLRQHNFGHLA
jgi:hypothetical protein